MHDPREWVAIGIDYPAERLEQRVRTHAHTKPDAPAVMTPDQTLSWREVDAAADGLAAHLSALGLRPGDRIGWLARNSPEFVVLLVAARRLRLVLVGFNWRLSPRELEDVFQTVPPALTVTDAEALEKFSPPSPVLLTGDDFWRASATADRVEYSLPRPDEACTIIFTSGSSGRPKPVVYGLEAYERRVCAPVALPFFTDTRLMIIAPQFHSAGLHWTQYGLIGGWPQVLLPSADPALMLETVEQFDVTHAQWLPTMLHLAVAEQRARPRDLSSLQYISYGASPISPQLLQDVTSEFACQFSQVYGLTEVMGAVGHLSPADHRRDWGVRGPPTAYPDPGTQVRIVDDGGRPQNAGAPGYIEVRLDVAAPGYLKDGAVCSVAHADGWIATNDLGWLDEAGYIRVIGRKGDMIITGGENVYPLEVENMIAEQAEIEEVAVFGLADPLWGQRIAAAIVVRPGHSLSEGELLTRCRARMAHFKVPKRVMFVDALPRGATGKLLRSALPELAAAA